MQEECRYSKRKIHSKLTNSTATMPKSPSMAALEFQISAVVVKPQRGVESLGSDDGAFTWWKLIVRWNPITVWTQLHIKIKRAHSSWEFSSLDDKCGVWGAVWLQGNRPENSNTTWRYWNQLVAIPVGKNGYLEDDLLVKKGIEEIAALEVKVFMVKRKEIEVEVTMLPK